MSLFQTGFELIDNFLPLHTIDTINEDLSKLPGEMTGGGIRNAEKKLKTISALVKSERIIQARSYLFGEVSLVRAILFIRDREHNWLVSWHQDKTVAVTSRFDSPGWGPWSRKDNVLHVQPPVEVLEQMVTFRIHLDKAIRQNGCLKLLPGSHTHGLLSQEKIYFLTEKNIPQFCEANIGSMLVMRPHVIHASGKASAPAPRRVLHLEFSSYPLPENVSWA